MSWYKEFDYTTAYGKAAEKADGKEHPHPYTMSKLHIPYMPPLELGDFADPRFPAIRKPSFYEVPDSFEVGTQVMFEVCKEHYEAEIDKLNKELEIIKTLNEAMQKKLRGEE